MEGEVDVFIKPAQRGGTGAAGASGATIGSNHGGLPLIPSAVLLRSRSASWKGGVLIEEGLIGVLSENDVDDLISSSREEPEGISFDLFAANTFGCLGIVFYQPQGLQIDGSIDSCLVFVNRARRIANVMDADVLEISETLSLPFSIKHSGGREDGNGSKGVSQLASTFAASASIIAISPSSSSSSSLMPPPSPPQSQPSSCTTTNNPSTFFSDTFMSGLIFSRGVYDVCSSLSCNYRQHDKAAHERVYCWNEGLLQPLHILSHDARSHIFIHAMKGFIQTFQDILPLNHPQPQPQPQPQILSAPHTSTLPVPTQQQEITIHIITRVARQGFVHNQLLAFDDSMLVEVEHILCNTSLCLSYLQFLFVPSALCKSYISPSPTSSVSSLSASTTHIGTLSCCHSAAAVMELLHHLYHRLLLWKSFAIPSLEAAAVSPMLMDLGVRRGNSYVNGEELSEEDASGYIDGSFTRFFYFAWKCSEERALLRQVGVVGFVGDCEGCVVPTLQLARHVVGKLAEELMGGELRGEGTRVIDAVSGALRSQLEGLLHTVSFRREASATLAASLGVLPMSVTQTLQLAGHISPLSLVLPSVHPLRAYFRNIFSGMSHVSSLFHPKPAAVRVLTLSSTETSPLPPAATIAGMVLNAFDSAFDRPTLCALGLFAPGSPDWSAVVASVGKEVELSAMLACACSQGNGCLLLFARGESVGHLSNILPAHSDKCLGISLQYHSTPMYFVFLCNATSQLLPSLLQEPRTTSSVEEPPGHTKTPSLPSAPTETQRDAFLSSAYSSSQDTSTRNPSDNMFDVVALLQILGWQSIKYSSSSYPFFHSGTSSFSSFPPLATSHTNVLSAVASQPPDFVFVLAHVSSAVHLPVQHASETYAKLVSDREWAVLQEHDVFLQGLKQSWRSVFAVPFLAAPPTSDTDKGIEDNSRDIECCNESALALTDTSQASPTVWSIVPKPGYRDHVLVPHYQHIENYEPLTTATGVLLSTTVEAYALDVQALATTHAALSASLGTDDTRLLVEWREEGREAARAWVDAMGGSFLHAFQEYGIAYFASKEVRHVIDYITIILHHFHID